MEYSFNEFLAEFKAGHRSLDQKGELDDVSVYTWFHRALLRLGKNLCSPHEVTVHLDSKGEGSLPSNFYEAIKVLVADPLCREVEDVVDEYPLGLSVYVEENRRGYRWNSCDSCCVDESETVITRTETFRNHRVSYKYGNCRMVHIVRGSNVLLGCAGLNKWEADCSVSIQGGTIKSSLGEVGLYVEYYGLPMDEEGRVKIPDKTNGELYDYVEAFCKVQLYERLITGGDSSLAGLYNKYVQDVGELKRAATGAIKMSQITTRVINKAKNRDRARGFDRYKINGR